jgi:hypothetical protein
VQFQFQFQVPGDLEIGVYSNTMSIWTGPHDFTLDFAITGQSVPQEDGSVVVPCRVVTRVKIPLAMAQDVLRAMATHVSDFEAQVGRIPRIGDGQPTYLPEEFK